MATYSAPYDLNSLRPATKPRLEKVPESIGHFGETTAEFNKRIGLTLFPWQEHILARLFAVTDSHDWAPTEAGVLCARQNGKGEILAAYAIDHLFLFPRPDNKPKTILYSAHLYSTAQEGFRRIKGVIESSPALMTKVAKIYDSAGMQEIILHPRKGQTTGDRLKFVARSKSGSRGFTVDVMILDEAQELSAPAYASLSYTQTTIPNPQTLMVGTVPDDEQNDYEIFEALRDRGRSPKGENTRTYWAEFSPEGSEEWESSLKIDPYDPQVWAQANPSLNMPIPGTDTALILPDTVLAQLERDNSGSKESFKRERLSIWPTKPLRSEDDTKNDVDITLWEESAQHPAPMHGESLTLSVQVADSGSHASISVASELPDGRLYVEHIHSQMQTLWVPGKLKSLMSELGTQSVILDEKKCAGIVPDLKREKIKYFSVRPSELAGAHALFVELANASRLVHRGQDSLTESLKHAGIRNVASYGSTWSQDDPTESITQIQSATLAVFGVKNAQQIKPKRGIVRGFA